MMDRLIAGISIALFVFVSIPIGASTFGRQGNDALVVRGSADTGSTADGVLRTSLPRTIKVPYGNPTTIQAIEPEPFIAPPSIQSQILLAAQHFHVDADMLVNVARCESGLRADAVNASSGATGIFQYLDTTWRANALRYWGPWMTDMRRDPMASATLAAWMISQGQLHQWDCARILGYT